MTSLKGISREIFNFINSTNFDATLIYNFSADIVDVRQQFVMGYGFVISAGSKLHFWNPNTFSMKYPPLTSLPFSLFIGSQNWVDLIYSLHFDYDGKSHSVNIEKHWVIFKE